MAACLKYDIVGDMDWDDPTDDMDVKDAFLPQGRDDVTGDVLLLNDRAVQSTDDRDRDDNDDSDLGDGSASFLTGEAAAGRGDAATLTRMTMRGVAGCDAIGIAALTESMGDRVPACR